MGSKYERELRDDFLRPWDWFVVRAAGSLGKIDMVGSRVEDEHERVAWIQEKACRGDTLYLTESSGKVWKEIRDHLKPLAKTGRNVYLAVRYKGLPQSLETHERWNVFDPLSIHDSSPLHHGEGRPLKEVFG